MGNRHSGKRLLTGRRAWLTGTLAVGVVAASGAGAFAAMQEPTEQTAEGAAPSVSAQPVAPNTEPPPQDCVALDAQTMAAIFEAWMEQGGGFRPGTLNRNSFRPGHYQPGSIKTKTFMFGRKPATVELSKLHLTACPDEGTTPTDTPTIVPPVTPSQEPTTAPAPTETTPAPAPTTEPPAPVPSTTTVAPAPVPSTTSATPVPPVTSTAS